MRLHTVDPQIAADFNSCAALIRGGSKSFFLASLLLPREARRCALALYAFCRLADDSIDEGQGGDRLADLRARLDAIYRGEPGDIAADRAFARTVLRHSIPRDFPEALLEGFEWDVQSRRYADLDELVPYGVRVAGSVGVMMACIMGAHSAEAAARACDLGVAMQLTNIARDVGEDARAGRLYLPVKWLEEAGLNPDEWLADPVFCPALKSVILRLLEEADRLYERAGAGIALLPRRCRWGVRAASLIYREIGHQLRETGGDCVSRRTVVSPGRKAALLFTACVQELSGPAIRWLDRRIEWLFMLFLRLELRDRLTRPGRLPFNARSGAS